MRMKSSDDFKCLEIHFSLSATPLCRRHKNLTFITETIPALLDFHYWEKKEASKLDVET